VESTKFYALTKFGGLHKITEATTSHSCTNHSVQNNHNLWQTAKNLCPQQIPTKPSRDMHCVCKYRRFARSNVCVTNQWVHCWFVYHMLYQCLSTKSGLLLPCISIFYNLTTNIFSYSIYFLIVWSAVKSKKNERKCTCNVTLKRVRETTVAVEEQLNITYFSVCMRAPVCVCARAQVCTGVKARVALFIQHATCMRYIVLPFVASNSTKCFDITS
jgi:hypothetical protein